MFGHGQNNGIHEGRVGLERSLPGMEVEEGAARSKEPISIVECGAEATVSTVEGRSEALEGRVEVLEESVEDVAVGCGLTMVIW